MKFAHSSHRATGRLLSGGVALLALLVTSCTSTGTGPDGKPMQMTANSNGSMIAETLQSAADQTEAAETSTKADAKAGTTETASATPPPAARNEKLTEAAKQPAADAEPAQQVAAAAPQQKSTSLFGMFGSGKPADAQPAETAQAAAEDAADKPAAVPAKAEEPAAAKPAKANESEKPVQLASLAGAAPAAATAFATPQRPTASQGSIARLFGGDSADPRSDRAETRKVASVKPASTTAARDYNYSLPGVRPNGGIEIKHRNSMSDDSDIDANEDDAYGGVTLASAPGLARLAPNGLKVQRETVDVACLKPQLVSMLRTMERHFRRPVMVTSGYRSPSYNRKVNGARKSMHMICAAADIQIDGVSKWEIARFARSMPGRGGVGTYCHTTSVHVDVGPERDWNWRCKG